MSRCTLSSSMSAVTVARYSEEKSGVDHEVSYSGKLEFASVYTLCPGSTVTPARQPCAQPDLPLHAGSLDGKAGSLDASMSNNSPEDSHTVDGPSAGGSDATQASSWRPSHAQRMHRSSSWLTNAVSCLTGGWEACEESPTQQGELRLCHLQSGDPGRQTAAAKSALPAFTAEVSTSSSSA